MTSGLPETISWRRWRMNIIGLRQELDLTLVIGTQGAQTRLMNSAALSSRKTSTLRPKAPTNGTTTDVTSQLDSFVSIPIPRSMLGT